MWRSLASCETLLQLLMRSTARLRNFSGYLSRHFLFTLHLLSPKSVPPESNLKAGQVQTRSPTVSSRLQKDPIEQETLALRRFLRETCVVGIRTTLPTSLLIGKQAPTTNSRRRSVFRAVHAT